MSQKLGPSKADNRALKDHLAIDLDSPPITPKSVRPPLPLEIEADLRAACTVVLQGGKPITGGYEDAWKNGKAQLDYDTIRSGAGAAPAPARRRQPAEHVSAPLSHSHTNASPPVPEAPMENLDSDKFRYKPNTATEDLFKEDDARKMQNRRSRAATRADELMAGPPQPPEHKTLPRSGSQSRPKSIPHAAGTLAAPKTEQTDRPRHAPRTASTETTGSTPQTDSTDYPWSASTAMTSAANTPARGSKRTSTQALQAGAESSSHPKVEPVDADWMRQELESYKKAREDEYKSPAAQAVTAEMADSGVASPSSQLPTPLARVPPRKPVGKVSSEEEKEKSSPLASNENETSQLEPQVSSESRKQSMETRRQQAESRQGRRGRRDDHEPAPTRAASRAASRARSITREVREYMRSASRSRQHSSRKHDEMPRHRRSESRSRAAMNGVREYFRPGSSAGSRNASIDMPNMSRSMSHETFVSAKSETSHGRSAAKPKAKFSVPFHANLTFHSKKASASSDELSRPGTARSADQDDGLSTNTSSTPKAKPPINLNRELPPLPSLDSWQTEEAPPARPVDVYSPTTGSMKSKPTSPKVARVPTGMQSNFGKGSLGEKDEILAARMGSPSSTKSPAKDAKKSYFPPMPKAAPPQPPGSMARYGKVDTPPQQTLSPTSGRPTGRRRRSQSVHDASVPSLTEKLRQASANSPNGKPIAAVGKAQIVDSGRSTPSGGFAGKLGRTISMKRLNAHHHAHQQKNATSANTPLGHSRNNSDHANKPPRKMSMDEYGRNYDARRRNNGDLPDSRPSFGAISGTSTPRAPGAASAQGAKQPAKKQWWRIAALEKKKEQTWMDQVVRSGAHSGMIDANGTADAPVIRY